MLCLTSRKYKGKKKSVEENDFIIFSYTIEKKIKIN